ncbi:MAG: nitroreductase [Methanobacterium sp.]
MNVIEALNSRFTCRAFKEGPVNSETVLKIMEGAIRSPSWANTQPWEIFIAGGEVLEKIRRAYMENFANDVPRDPDIPWVSKWPVKHEERIKELGISRYKHLGISRDDEVAKNASWRLNFKFFGAPIVIYLCMDETLSEWSIFDLGSLSQSIMLAAQGFGVDTAPAVNLVAYPKIIRREMEIPDELTVVFGIAMGYSDNKSPQNTFRSSRRNLEDVVRLKGI